MMLTASDEGISTEENPESALAHSSKKLMLMIRLTGVLVAVIPNPPERHFSFAMIVPFLVLLHLQQCGFSRICVSLQSINQSLFAAISKYSTTVVNRQLWTGQ